MGEKLFRLGLSQIGHLDGLFIGSSKCVLNRDPGVSKLSLAPESVVAEVEKGFAIERGAEAPPPLREASGHDDGLNHRPRSASYGRATEYASLSE